MAFRSGPSETEKYRAVELLKAGKSVADVAAQFEVEPAWFLGNADEINKLAGSVVIKPAKK